MKLFQLSPPIFTTNPRGATTCGSFYLFSLCVALVELGRGKDGDKMRMSWLCLSLPLTSLAVGFLSLPPHQSHWGHQPPLLLCMKPSETSTADKAFSFLFSSKATAVHVSSFSATIDVAAYDINASEEENVFKNCFLVLMELYFASVALMICNRFPSPCCFYNWKGTS